MGRAPRFLRHDRMHESHGFYNRQGRLKGFRRHLCAMRTTSTVGCAPRFLWRDRMHESHGFYNCQGRLKGFRRPLCAMRTITLCFHKANRTYVLRPLRPPLGRAPRFLRHDRMHESHGFYNRQGRLKKIFQPQAGYLYPTFIFALMLVLRTSVGFENPTYTPPTARRV